MMKARVVIVDDDVELVDGLCRALRREPFVILGAHSAQEALRILATDVVDVVVADEKMPGMSGGELMVRVHEEYPATLRIILTGNADLQSTMTAIHDGCVFRYLEKPTKAPDLAAVIRHGLLERSLLAETENSPRMEREDREALFLRMVEKAHKASSISEFNERALVDICGFTLGACLGEKVMPLSLEVAPLHPPMIAAGVKIDGTWSGAIAFLCPVALVEKVTAVLLRKRRPHNVVSHAQALDAVLSTIVEQLRKALPEDCVVSVPRAFSDDQGAELFVGCYLAAHAGVQLEGLAAHVCIYEKCTP